jgi:glucan phosphoethanolaminetransferase (alkaline phosphatase superfamily)
VAVGLLKDSTLTIVILLLPATIYEVYRTEGKSTKSSSVIMLLLLIGQVFLVLFNVEFNLAEFLGTTQEYIGGYLVPLGEITVVGPTLMAVLAVILFVRTRGKFTRWLAAVIFITAFAIIYSVDPEIFTELFKYGIQEGMRRI